MNLPILSAPEFYAQVTDYMNCADPSWLEEQWQSGMKTESQALAVLGEANGRSVLDCSCGTGRQAIPLAKLGWHVTASDITDAYLNIAKHRCQQEDVKIDFHVCDMRHLRDCFQAQFDCVVSCMALDNITADAEIQQAIKGMFDVLKPQGICYLRLRDFDNLSSIKPRYEFKEERIIPHGRIIRLEDWDYESETHVVYIDVFLREDDRKKDYAWDTNTFSYRRRALRKTELEQFMRDAGFREIDFLPRPNNWHPYEILAHK